MEPSTKNNHHKEKEGIVTQDEVEELMKGLPKVAFMGCSKRQLIDFQGFYLPVASFKDNLNVQRHFQALDNDLIIASHPKTGTTWLKSLLFSLVNRNNRQNPTSRALLARNPHELVLPITECPLDTPMSPTPTIPRLLSTHLPYTCLPKSITTLTSVCRIVYIGRNPLDTLVSQWHFYPNLIKKLVGESDFEPPSMEDYLEDFYHGRIPYGPFFDHVLGYWNQSLEQPDKLLFLKYEDMKDDTSFHLKRLAEFVGLPFSSQEESEGVIKEIADMCNINNLKELEVNKSGVILNVFEKKEFFRKGQVGDWINYLTPQMGEKIIKLMEQKLGGTGLSFQLLPDQ